MTERVLAVRDLTKSFRDPEGGRVVALDLPSLDVARGDRVAVRGESGSGKTTLLHLVAGILPADSGTIEVCGEPMTGRSEASRDALRARRIGYLFQTFNLLPHLTAVENVALGLAFGEGGPGGTVRTRAAKALERVGLGDRLRHRPAQLLRRAAAARRDRARALAGRPALVLADEPTAALDRPRAEQCLDLLLAFATEADAGLLVVTHDEDVFARFPRQVTLRAPAPEVEGAGALRDVVR